MDETRCLLQGACLPKYSRGELCYTVVYIINNRLPRAILDNDTPYHMMLGKLYLCHMFG